MISIKPTTKLIQAILLASLFICPLSAKETSDLWGKNGELWKPDPKNQAYTKLLDFTDVGYMKGDVRLPDWPVGVNVKDFGAVGDGETDDTKALIEAIKAELTRIDRELTTPGLFAQDPEKAAKLSRRRSDGTGALLLWEEKWLELAERLEDA